MSFTLTLDFYIYIYIYSDWTSKKTITDLILSETGDEIPLSGLLISDLLTWKNNNAKD